MMKRLTDTYTIRRIAKPTEVLAESLLKQGAAAYVRMYNRLQPMTPVEAISLVDGCVLEV